ncbi:Npt1/Npt2 family nucleotide transporter [Candidatus Similichlamydia epinepheli]|uniref:Npt1/Npt2 family nucleotide transporter n=1 Tax=Candidatus Similichlamydia epinepheli TaxID=1903953 RepID=UPI001300930A|nr:Npt1/Npt2 family nucleotide transporter [Candidatus Similichlamydia epinepheli]
MFSWKFAIVAACGSLVLLRLFKSEVLDSLRAYFFPVERGETRILVPLTVILFLIAFNYYGLKSTKDTLVITSAGASAVPFIKTWALLPSTFCASYFFAILSLRIGSRRAFLVMLSLFLSFYAVFIFVLYPKRNDLLFNSLANWIEPYLPKGFDAIPILIRHWSFTLFYIISELWSVIILNICFWGFLNEVIAIEQAKRLYPLLRTGLNFAGILSGRVGLYFAAMPFDPTLPFGETAWDQALTKMMVAVLTSGAAIFLIFCWVSSQFKQKKTVPQTTNRPKQNSLKEGWSLLFHNQTILCLSSVTFAYNLLLNLGEVLWTAQTYSLCPDPLSFSSYMHRVAIVTSFVASLSAFFMTGNLLKHFSWLTTALITPFISLVTSLFFFLFLFLPHKTAFLASWVGVSPLEATVFFGALQSCLARSFKSALLDINKDLVLMELSGALRVKGKAIIDGLAARSGKATASISLTILLGLLGSIDACTAPIGILSCATISSWLTATYKLGKNRHSRRTENAIFYSNKDDFSSR